MAQKEETPRPGAALPMRAEEATPHAPAAIDPALPPGLAGLVPPPLGDEEVNSTRVFVSLQVPWVKLIVGWARAHRRG